MTSAEVIGRSAELAAIERFLSRAAEAQAALVVEGAAGIGKTTLWEAVRVGATERGHTVLSSRPALGESGLALAGLGDLFAEIPDDTIDELPDPQRRALGAARSK